MKKKSSVLSIVIGAVIGTTLAVYSADQQATTVSNCTYSSQAGPRVIEAKVLTKEEPELIELGEFKLTAYCSCEKCCDGWALNRPTDEEGKPIVYGASGEILEAGVSIAVDSNLIPYGTEVIINGNTYIAHDCGGAIKGNRIDVYFDNHQDALEFGVQHANVILKKEGMKDGRKADL